MSIDWLTCKLSESEFTELGNLQNKKNKKNSYCRYGLESAVVENAPSVS